MQSIIDYELNHRAEKQDVRRRLRLLLLLWVVGQPILNRRIDLKEQRHACIFFRCDIRRYIDSSLEILWSAAYYDMR